MRLKGLFLVLVWGALLLILAFYLGLRSYRVFTHSERVAVVRSLPVSQGVSHRFLLEVTPVHRGILQAPQRYPMAGEQWMIGGDILKWSPWLHWMGFRSCHKLTRLSSRYLRARDELSAPRSAYDLNGGTDFLWRLLYRIGPSFPLVETVYGNSAYTMARPGTQWEVRVTHSGYFIKPIDGKPDGIKEMP